MRLTSAYVSGFGRLVDAKINLDAKVIAIVGPNEAGKTTLLDALAYVETNETLSAAQRSRASTVGDDDRVITLTYYTDPQDLLALDGLDLETLPTRIQVSRRAGRQETSTQVFPAPFPNPTPLRRAVRVLGEHIKTKSFAKRLAPVPEDSEVANAERGIAQAIQTTVAVIAQLAAAEHPVPNEAITESVTELLNHGEALKLPTSTSRALQSAADWLGRGDPRDEVRNRLWRQTPDILLFGDNDRTLQSSYQLDETTAPKPPPALANLANLADLDLNALWDAISTGLEGIRETLILRANQTLTRKFQQAWNQSNVSIHLKVEGQVLQVMINENDEMITAFDERSAGLRMFVAMTAFIGTRDSHRPPVLLLDEAETHLHLDAQADLVNMFMRQSQAAKIVYTTHSPACLPPDLGTSIRAVVPSPTNGQVSEVLNGFWQCSIGYSPLMIAMGAGAAAFSAVRFAVLAEGPSEMILLPTLIRLATRQESLGYQIAPGLSSAPKAFFPDLDLEAARVAYLVDGDKGGARLKQLLLDAGIPEERIVELGAVTLENLLSAECYTTNLLVLVQAINEGVPIPDLPDFSQHPNISWSALLDKWGKRHGLRVPSKPIVANRIVQEVNAEISPSGRTALQQLDLKLRTALGLTN